MKWSGHFKIKPKWCFGKSCPSKFHFLARGNNWAGEKASYPVPAKITWKQALLSTWQLPNHCWGSQCTAGLGRILRKNVEREREALKVPSTLWLSHMGWERPGQEKPFSPSIWNNPCRSSAFVYDSKSFHKLFTFHPLIVIIWHPGMGWNSFLLCNVRNQTAGEFSHCAKLPIQSLFLYKPLPTWAQCFHPCKDGVAVWECLEKAFEEGQIRLEFQF